MAGLTFHLLVLLLAPALRVDETPLQTIPWGLGGTLSACSPLPVAGAWQR